MRGVYRRGNIWWYRWSHRGRQYRTSLETEDEAKAIIAAREIMANPGCLVESSEADPVERYCRWLVDHGRSRNTANSRRHLFRQLLEATGAASYARLRPDQAREWYRGEVARLHPSTAASTLQNVRHSLGMEETEIVIVQIPRETSKKFHFLFDGRLTPWHNGGVPNQPDPDKQMLGLRMPRTLKARLEKLAALRNETVTDVVIALIERAVRNVRLSSQDYEQIARETFAAEQRIQRRLAHRENSGGTQDEAPEGRDD